MGHRLLPHSPELFHGKKTSGPYFEGWFFKHSSQQGSLAVIPGVFRGRDSGADMSFIQVLLGSPVQSYFTRFPYDAFHSDADSFAIRVADSVFSLHGISLDIKELDLKAQLKYSGIVPLKKSFFSPSIMGPFSYLPSMQCNHGVLSLKHDVSGYLSCKGRLIDFNGADGYIEKDWGEAFPKSWIWMQCGDKESAFMCSIAHIPYGPVRFTGLICVLLAGGRQYRFATYNGAKVTDIKARKGAIRVEIKRKHIRLTAVAENSEFGSLKAPSKTGMDRIISESLSAKYHITLLENGKEVFTGGFTGGGLEVFKAEDLIRQLNNNGPP